MPLEQRQLHIGDVMIMKAKMKLSHFGIAFGQALFSHNHQNAGALSVHPAIYVGRGRVIEATSGGLRERQADGRWNVFRYRERPVARRAMSMAISKLNHRTRDNDFGKYAHAKAVASLFHSSSLGNNSLQRLTGPEAGSRKYFCSEFVIQCYFEAAGGGVGNAPIRAGRVTSPKDMHARINRDTRWTHVGFYEE